MGRCLWMAPHIFAHIFISHAGVDAPPAKVAHITYNIIADNVMHVCMYVGITCRTYPPHIHTRRRGGRGIYIFFLTIYIYSALPAHYDSNILGHRHADMCTPCLECNTYIHTCIHNICVDIFKWMCYTGFCFNEMDGVNEMLHQDLFLNEIDVIRRRVEENEEGSGSVLVNVTTPEGKTVRGFMTGLGEDALTGCPCVTVQCDASAQIETHSPVENAKEAIGRLSTDEVEKLNKDVQDLP